MGIEYAQTWDILEQVLNEIDYRRDKPPLTYPQFRLDRDDANNHALLHFYTYNDNTYDEKNKRLTNHELLVPCATYHRQGWIRWVWNQIESVSRHEDAECFQVNGVRVYAPHHGNGWSPYDFWPGHDVEEKLKAPGDD